jgi:hypothetical protein
VKPLAAQIEKPVLEPDVLGIFLLAEHRHRQLAGRTQHLDRADIDLDGTGREVRVFGAGGAPAHLAIDPHYPFRSQLLGVLEGRRIGIDHHLGEAVVIAQVDEQHSAMVANAVAPAGQTYFLADVACAQGAAGMGAIVVHDQ